MVLGKLHLQIEDQLLVSLTGGRRIHSGVRVLSLLFKGIFTKSLVLFGGRPVRVHRRAALVASFRRKFSRFRRILRGSSSSAAPSDFAEGASHPRGQALPVHSQLGVASPSTCPGPSALAGTPGTHKKHRRTRFRGSITYQVLSCETYWISKRLHMNGPTVLRVYKVVGVPCARAASMDTVHHREDARGPR